MYVHAELAKLMSEERALRLLAEAAQMRMLKIAEADLASNEREQSWLPQRIDTAWRWLAQRAANQYIPNWFSPDFN